MQSNLCRSPHGCEQPARRSQHKRHNRDPLPVLPEGRKGRSPQAGAGSAHHARCCGARRRPTSTCPRRSPAPRSGLALARRAHGRAGAARQSAAGPAAASLGCWWLLGACGAARPPSERALSPACSPAAPPTLAARLSGGGRGSRRRGRGAAARRPGVSLARGGARRLVAQAGPQVTKSSGASTRASPAAASPEPRRAGSSHTSRRPGGRQAGGRAHLPSPAALITLIPPLTSPASQHSGEEP